MSQKSVPEFQQKPYRLPEALPRQKIHVLLLYLIPARPVAAFCNNEALSVRQIHTLPSNLQQRLFSRQTKNSLTISTEATYENAQEFSFIGTAIAY